MSVRLSLSWLLRINSASFQNHPHRSLSSQWCTLGRKPWMGLSAVRVLLLDYRKAFDLVDHKILADKILALRVPCGVACSVCDFLFDRRQWVNFSRDCFSEWGSVPAGVPQGTKLGTWLFILMINGLHPPASDASGSHRESKWNSEHRNSSRAVVYPKQNTYSWIQISVRNCWLTSEDLQSLS